MNRLLPAAVVLPLLLFARSPLAQAAHPLEAYPDTVAVVFRFESVDRYAGSVHEMLGAISPGIDASAADFENDVIGRMLELHDHLDAIDRRAPAYVALLPIDGVGPPAAILVKAADREKLLTGLMRIDNLDGVNERELANGFTKYEGSGRPVLLARWNDYWLITRHEQVADALALKSENRRTMADVLDMRARTVFDGGDAALAINSAHLAKKFKTQIEAARQRIFDTIDAIPEEQLGESAEVARKMYRGMTVVAFDALFDSKWAVGHVTLSAEGGQVEGLAGVREGSKTDKLLAANPPSSLETLGLLPAAASIYLGIAVDYQQLLKTLTPAAYSATAKDAKEVEAATDLMRDADVKSTVVSYALPEGDGQGLRATTLQEVGDVGKMRDGLRRFISASGETKTPLFSMSFDLKPDAEKYKQHSIDVMAMKFKFLGEGEFAALSGLYDFLFGGETLQTRSTSVGSLFVQATGNDASQMRKVLDGVTEGEGVVALEDAFGKARDKLGEEANLMLLIDGPRMVTDTVGMLSRVEPIATGLRAAPFNFAAKQAASYAGLSLSAEPQSLRLKAFVPVEQSRGMLKIFAPGL